MINAFVLYGTPEQPNRDVFDIGLALFQALNIDVSIQLLKINRLGYRVTKSVNTEGLIRAFDTEPFNFEISQNAGGRLFYFSQSIRAVGAYNTIKFGGFSDSELSTKECDSCIKDILSHVSCRYGFSYQSSNSFKAINYVNDIGISSVNQYDAPMKWQRKFMYSNDDTGYSHHLRLIYERNYLTAKHLALKLDGKPLLEWINQESYRGKILPVNDDIYLWQIAPEYLEDINRQCGQAGLLISFVEPKKSYLKK